MGKVGAAEPYLIPLTDEMGSKKEAYKQWEIGTVYLKLES
jgi:hypothetical protein